MKSKMKIMLLGVLAACALSAVVSASASAAQWRVNGTAFAGTETIAAKIKPSTTFNLTSKLPGGVEVEIVCTNVVANQAKIEANNKNKASSIVFTGCSATKPTPNCTSPTEIKTVPVTTEIITVGELVFDEFKPTTGTEFTKFTLTGSACEGAFKVTGTARGLVVAAATESVEKELLFSSTTGGALKFGTEPATLSGTGLFSLAGANKGAKWSGKVS